MVIAKRMASVFIAVAVALSVCFALTGCSGLSPKQTVEKSFAAFKAADKDSLAKYYSGNADEIDKFSQVGLSGSEEDMSATQKAFLEKLGGMMMDFDYTVGEEKIDGNNATVEVTITTYDFGNAFYNAFSNYFSKALALAFSGASEEAMTDLFLSEYSSQLESLTSKTCTNTITVNLTKEDNQWKMCALDSAASDALAGNLISKTESLSNSLNA